MPLSIQQRVFKIAAEAFEVPLASLSRDSSPATVPAWDDIAIATILDNLAHSLRIEFEPEDVQGVRNLGDIIDAAEELFFGRRI